MRLLRSKRPFALVLVSATAAALAAVAVAYPVEKVLAHRTARGTRASAVVVTQRGAYTHFSIRVTASPNQRVKAGWGFLCGGVYSGGRDAQDFVARTPVTRTLRAVPPEWQTLPCTIEGDGKLSGRGRITVELLAH